MSSVIKVPEQAQLPLGASFNLDDFTHHGDALLKKVRDQAAVQAAQILMQAKADAEKIRREAEAAGRKAAEQSVDAMVAERAKQQVAEQIKTLLPTLERAVERLHEEKHLWFVAWEKRFVRLACKIAERVIRRELAAKPEIALALIKESLELAASCPEVKLMVHPADHAAMGDEIHRIVAECSRMATAKIVADESVSRGGCRIESRYGVIDQRIETQLRRIEAELT